MGGVKLLCRFETNCPDLDAIWRAAYPLAEQAALTDVTACSGTIFLTYIGACLLLSDDRDAAFRALQRRMAYLSGAQGKASDPFGLVCCLMACREYADVTGENPAEQTPLLSIRDSISSRLDSDSCPAPDRPLLLAARILTDRFLRRSTSPVSGSGADLLAFQRACFDCKSGVYLDAQGVPSLLLNLTAAWLGILSDDGRESVCDFLITHTFDVPRELRGILYRTLSDLSCYDALFSALTEAGTPPLDDPMCAVSDVLAIARDLCGVDIAAYGSGCARFLSHIPSPYSFRLVLSSANGPLYYEA